MIISGTIDKLLIGGGIKILLKVSHSLPQEEIIKLANQYFKALSEKGQTLDICLIVISLFRIGLIQRYFFD